MPQETSLLRTVEFANTRLRRSLFLSRGHVRMRVEPDSTVSYLNSSRVRRILFGRGSVELFKVQAGVIIPLRQKELKVRLSPTSVEFTSGQQDPVQVSQILQMATGRTEGYSRRIRLTNRSDAGLRLRILTTHDPTSMNFRKESDPPGPVGVNAFNRGDHVVMDDVGDTTGARVVGFSPQPSVIYMTKDRARAIELLGSGQVPDSVAGISGTIAIITQHEAEVAPRASFEISVASIYHDSSLGDVLAELPSMLGPSPTPSETEGVFGCSNPAVSFAYGWARAAMHAIEYEPDLSERLSAGFALGLLRPGRFEEDFESARGLQRRDGWIPSGAGRAGPRETSLFIIHACSHIQLRGDKKLARKWYPALRKAGIAIQKGATGGLIQADGSSSDGWRRRLESGFPTGCTSEVNVMAAKALKELAALAYSLGKGKDSAGFSESGLGIAGLIGARLRDPKTGSLALNLDPKGRLHLEPTVDQAVALSYDPYDAGLASSMVHRLLEKDFESGYGPRCVPTSNALYYSSTYGDGQLGSCWTRGTLWHSMLAYLSGYPGIGGVQMEKVARLVHSDWEKLSGVPGEFPYWLDAERHSVVGAGSDPVAAGLFVQALVVGELGLTFTPNGLRLKPPETSGLGWVLAHEIDLGEKGSVFLGRTKTGVWIASNFQRVKTESPEYQHCELIENSSSLQALAFWNRSSVVVCAGLAGNAPWSGNISIPINGKPIATSLFADLEELDQGTGKWKKLERRRLADRAELRLALEGSSWKAFRFTKV